MEAARRIRAWMRDNLALVLMGGAFLAVAALPGIAYALTPVGRAGDFSSALHAHVAWSRGLALALATAAAFALARAHAVEPARAASQAARVLGLCALVGLAASVPLYDDWLEARVQAHYTSEDGWRVDNAAGHSGEWNLMFRHEMRTDDLQGALAVQFPQLSKGDEYHAYVSFQADAPDAFFRSGMHGVDAHRCTGWDGQMPAAPAAEGERSGHTSVHMRHCTVPASGSPHVVVQWGDDAPVATHFGVLLQPTYVNVIAARVDDSLFLVALMGGIGAHVAYAGAHARRPHASRWTAPALSLAPAAFALGWLGAALGPSRWMLPRDPTTTGAFVFLAALTALVIVGAAVAAWANRLPPRVAVRWSAFTACGLAISALMAAPRVWRFDVPWVLVGMMGTFLLAGFCLWAAERMPAFDETAPPLR